MFDYISAIYYGEGFGACRPCPLDQPADQRERELNKQLDRIADTLGEDFAKTLRGNLRVILNGRQLEAFQDGVRMGGQLTASILLDPQ